MAPHKGGRRIEHRSVDDLLNSSPLYTTLNEKSSKEVDGPLPVTLPFLLRPPSSDPGSDFEAETHLVSVPRPQVPTQVVPDRTFLVLGVSETIDRVGVSRSPTLSFLPPLNPRSEGRPDATTTAPETENGQVRSTYRSSRQCREVFQGCRTFPSPRVRTDGKT